MKETKLLTKEVYHSDFLTIVEDTVMTSENIQTKRIVVKHSGASAQRECEEEAHVKPSTIEHVMSIHNCLGYSDEVIHLYIGYHCEEVKKPLDKDMDEFFEIGYYTKKEVQALLKNKMITDAKTIILLQHYFALNAF